MSFELEVITSSPPSRFILSEFVDSVAGIALSEDQSIIYLNSPIEKKCTHLIKIDGPHSVHPEDLEDSVIVVVVEAKWRIQIHVSDGSPAIAKELALGLAKFIAKGAQGAVYDPQLGKVISPEPRGSELSTKYQSKERIDTIKLEFFLPISSDSERTARTFLQVVRKHFLETLPTRFGGFEPMQGKILQDNEEPFITEWIRQESVAGNLFWKSQRPCFGGSSFFAAPNSLRFAPPQACCCQRLSLTFDGNAAESIPGWRDAIVTLFVQLAYELNAFYSAGYVERGVIAKNGNRIAYDGNSEFYYLQRSRWWVGIPSKPTWLAWFGSPYSDRLEPLLNNYPQFASRPFPGCIFLRMGSSALNLDQLESIFPRMPANLVQGEDPNQDPICADLIPTIN